MTPVNPKVLESLSWGVSAEVKAYVFYKEAAKIVKDENSRKTLLKLAGEEKTHYRVLERQHHSLITSEQWVTYNDILLQDGLPDINEEMASKHKEVIDQVRKAKTEREVLDIAYDLEKRSFDVYAEAADRATDPEEKSTFEYLSKFEKGHMQVIRKMIEAL
jgi:rubrerythrin